MVPKRASATQTASAKVKLFSGETFRNGVGDDALGALGGLQGGVAGDDGDAAGIGAEVDGTQVRVAGVRANVEGVEAQNFGDDGGEDIVRSLADFAGAGENGDAAAAVDLELHCGLRHFVPIDGKARAGQIGGAGQSDAAAFRELAEFVAPAGGLDDAANAFGEMDGAEA